MQYRAAAAAIDRELPKTENGPRARPAGRFGRNWVPKSPFIKAAGSRHAGRAAGGRASCVTVLATGVFVCCCQHVPGAAAAGGGSALKLPRRGPNRGTALCARDTLAY
jgi:hypothetical protein